MKNRKYERIVDQENQYPNNRSSRRKEQSKQKEEINNEIIQDLLE